MSYALVTYSYTASRLASVMSNGVLLAANEYDAKSRRVRKITPEYTATYFHDGWNLIEERVAYTNGQERVFRYLWGKDLSESLQGAGGVGGLLYVKRGGDIYIPCYDANGNITDYVDASGEVVASYAYDAFGGIISQSGTLAGAFAHRFSTKYFDAETGLYYYGYRFYSPGLMRWLNRDPIEESGGLNLYAFCRNKGVGACDMLGCFTIYVHTDGVGHVGIRNREGTTFDYGRYHGKYSHSNLYEGPNILARGLGITETHSYTRFGFNVCPLVDEKVSQVLDEKFASGMKHLPYDVISRYDKVPGPLSSNKRYMGTDWSPNDNCMTFTFSVLASAAGKVAQDASASQAERRQASDLVMLSFNACWKMTPSGIKSMLENFAAKTKWVSKE